MESKGAVLQDRGKHSLGSPAGYGHHHNPWLSPWAVQEEQHVDHKIWVFNSNIRVAQMPDSWWIPGLTISPFCNSTHLQLDLLLNSPSCLSPTSRGAPLLPLTSPSATSSTEKSCKQGFGICMGVGGGELLLTGGHPSDPLGLSLWRVCRLC